MKFKREGAFIVARIHQISGRIFSSILKEHNLGDISPAQGRVLFILWREDNIPIQRLVRETSLSKSTLTVMLDRLEDAGHIRRVHSKEDRREILIQLTEKDKSLKDTYTEISEEIATISCRGFTEKELDELEDSLRRILNNLIGYEAKMREKGK